MNKLHRTLLFVLVPFSLSIGVQSAFAAETAPEPDPATATVPNTALALQALVPTTRRAKKPHPAEEKCVQGPVHC